jgi:hypothetical protein
MQSDVREDAFSQLNHTTVEILQTPSASMASNGESALPRNADVSCGL